MSDKKEIPIDLISVLEQFESSMTNFAPIVGSYYIALVTNGVPSELASELIIEWHSLFWSMHLGQNKK